MNSCPFLSVIIPVFNVEKFLEKCLLSILSQSFCDFELLLINDGSTDSSASICKRYAENDLRIRFFDRQNCGVSATRQFGLEQCLGTYCIQIDSDDWIGDDYFKILIERAISDNADIVIASFIKEYPDHIEKPTLYTSRSVSNYINGMFSGRCWGSVWNKLIRTSIFKNNQLKFPMNVCMWEDFVFVVECMLFANRIAFCDNVFYHYVQYNSQSLCATTYRYDMPTHTIRAIEYLDFFLKEIGQYEEYKRGLSIVKQYAKQKLLFDPVFRDFKKWYSVFPESNSSFFRFLYCVIREKFLQTY